MSPRSAARAARSKLAERPAESASIAAGIVAVLGLLGHRVTPEERDGIVAAVALVAPVVTFFVARYRLARFNEDNGDATTNG